MTTRQMSSLCNEQREGGRGREVRGERREKTERGEERRGVRGREVRGGERKQGQSPTGVLPVAIW